jgi:hypothetical protein
VSATRLYFTRNSLLAKGRHLTCQNEATEAVLRKKTNVTLSPSRIHSHGASGNPLRPSGHVSQQPDGKHNYRNWILHDQEYAVLDLTNHYRYRGDKDSLVCACQLANYILKTFPKNPPTEIVWQLHLRKCDEEAAVGAAIVAVSTERMSRKTSL